MNIDWTSSIREIGRPVQPTPKCECWLRVVIKSQIKSDV